MKIDYSSIIDDLIIRHELPDSFEGIETFRSKEMEKLKNEIFEMLPKDKHDLFIEFINAITGHFVEIRDKNCSRSFFEGMKFGICFEKYLNDFYK